MSAPDPQADGDFDQLGGQEDDGLANAPMDAGDVPVDSEQDMENLGDVQADPMEPGPEVGTNQLAGYMQELEALLADLAQELGSDGEMGVDPGMGGEEEGLEGEEEFGGEEEGLEGEEGIEFEEGGEEEEGGEHRS